MESEHPARIASWVCRRESLLWADLRHVVLQTIGIQDSGNRARRTYHDDKILHPIPPYILLLTPCDIPRVASVGTLNFLIIVFCPETSHRRIRYMLAAYWERLSRWLYSDVTSKEHKDTMAENISDPGWLREILNEGICSSWMTIDRLLRPC